MNSTELLALFREEMDDAEDPPLWSDSLGYSYVDDAQKMFCRLTDGIEDSRTGAVTQLAITAATEWYDLSPLVLKVRTIFHGTTGIKLDVIPIEKAMKMGLRLDGRAGPASCFISGMEKGALRAYPVPTDTFTAQMSVFRLPLETITDVGDQELEIDEQHHRHLTMWMRALAYNKHDADTYNPRKAAEMDQAFRAYCAAAKIEKGRARHDAGTVMYGGL